MVRVGFGDERCRVPVTGNMHLLSWDSTPLVEEPSDRSRSGAR